MSNLKYLELWQQKRNELPVTNDPQTDWLDMQGLLDMHMPVSQATDGSNGDSNAGRSAGNGGTNLGTQLINLIKAKLFYSALAVIVTASVTYYAIKNIGGQKEDKPDKTELRKDSLLNNVTDSLLTDSLGMPDTATTIEQNIIADSVSSAQVEGDNTNTVIEPDEVKSQANKARNSSSSISHNNNRDASKSNTIANSNLGTGKAINGPGKRSVGNNSVAGTAHRPGVNSRSALPLSANARTNRARNKPNSQVKPFGDTRDTRYGNAGVGLNNSIVSVDKRRAGRNQQGYAAGNLNSSVSSSLFAKRDDNKTALQLPSPTVIFDWQDPIAAENKFANLLAKHLSTYKPTGVPKPGKALKKVKAKTSKTNRGFSTGNFDYGILGGIGSSKEFYGAPFITYNFTDKLAIGAEYRVSSPYTVKGGYNSPNKSTRDTLQTLTISDSRKIHTAYIPLYLMYNITKNVGVKGGAILNLPLKQTGGVSSFTTNGPRTDTSRYYKGIDSTLVYTSYMGKPGLSLTGGVRLNFNRLLLDVSYYQQLQTQQVNSPLGNYNFNRKGVQFSIGFKLNNPNKR